MIVLEGRSRAVHIRPRRSVLVDADYLRDYESGALNGYALALDFANQDYWVSGRRYAPVDTLPGYSFTRSGEQGALDAAAAVDYYAANNPAINDEGYHAYGALTNSLARSQEFDTADWQVFGGAAKGVSNAALAPDGTMTADEVSFSAGSQGSLYHLYAPPVGWNTLSFFVKRNAPTNQIFRLKQHDNLVDVYSNDFVATDQWQRFAFPANLVTGGGVGGYSISSGSAAPAASLFIWQGQSLPGNFPDGGPLIRTSASAASIGAGLLKDIAYPALADTNMIVMARAIAPALNGAVAYYAAEPNAGTDNRIILQFNNLGQVSGAVIAGGVVLYDQTVGGVVAAGQEVILLLRRLGGAWRVGKIIGTTLTWGTSAAAASVGTNKITVGNYQAGGYPLGERVRAVGIKYGSFTTDVEVLAAAAELA